MKTIGIQGGKGSFNEEALSSYLQRATITEYKVVYLHTSEHVLHELQEGTIDLGQVAIKNTLGGTVQESHDAMEKYKLIKVVDTYALPIRHALMIRPDVTLSEIDTIMAHPQVFAQCKNTLAQKYSHLKQSSGEGDLIDHALVAQQLAEKKLAKNIAVMGSKILAEIYGLSVVEENLEDSSNNYTSFLLLERKTM